MYRSISCLAAVLTLCLAQVGCVTGSAASTGSVSVEPLSAKDVHGDSCKYFSSLNTIIVPTAYVYVMSEGEVNVSQDHGMFSKDTNRVNAQMQATTTGIDKATLQATAKALQDATISRLKAQGYNVLTWDDVKNAPEMGKMLQRWSPKAPGGLVQVNSTMGDGKMHVVAAPTDEQAIEPKFQGMSWGWRDLATRMNALVVIPEFVYDMPQLRGETGRGYKQISASVSASPEMAMSTVKLSYVGPKLYVGMVSLKRGLLIEQPIGELTLQDTTPDAANALGQGLALLSGTGYTERTSAEATLAIDNSKFKNLAVISGNQALDVAIPQLVGKTQ